MRVKPVKTTVKTRNSSLKHELNNPNSVEKSKSSKRRSIAATVLCGAVLCGLFAAAIVVPLVYSLKTSNNEMTTATMTGTTGITSTVSTTVAPTSTPTTTAGRRAFALSQVINGQTVTCSSVVNTNSSYTECDDLEEGGLYAPNGITCTPGWSTAQSSYWATIAFCQAFLNSNNTYIQAYYNCNATQTRFTWSNGVWGTHNDNGYTQNLRCYY